jgi:CDP-glucose 4,6-dehydratase
MILDSSFWSNRRVFLTGHTGFKGSWLSLWLLSLGANLRGYALDPSTEPSLFRVLKLGRELDSVKADIRDFETLSKAVSEFKPEIVIHLAAQPLVRFSYANPLGTYSTNVMGTVNLFEAVRKTNSVRCVINVTTDKCYENREWVWGYREDDRLGGNDPYSNSKACSELVTTGFRESFFRSRGVAVASARAGNVIGGGDWSSDRLLPDLIAALNANRPAVIRSPTAIRPWQHVLDPLYGYLKLAERLACPTGNLFAEAWNFGPANEDAKRVDWIVDYIVKKVGLEISWQGGNHEELHESNYLKLDSSKSRARLDWEPRWGLIKALDSVLEWNFRYQSGIDAREVTLSQLNEYHTSW